MFARSVPDKRQSGVERPGPVGPSAFVSVVFQGGVVYPLSSFALASVPWSKFLSSGLTLTAHRPVKVCDVASRRDGATVCAPSRLAVEFYLQVLLSRGVVPLILYLYVAYEWNGIADGACISS